jgi:hypothetical protein
VPWFFDRLFTPMYAIGMSGMADTKLSKEGNFVVRGIFNV